MYSTCLHCHTSLGTNALIEHFPIGHQLAFDAAKGRLWVVCTRCKRWNLTPLEERWEAIEECERLYRGTRLRASTDNIGLARLSGGLEVIRIGSPRQPEISAWRYAGDFRRRWLTRGLPLASLAMAAPLANMAVGGFGPLGVWGGLGIVFGATAAITSVTGRARVISADGQVSTLKRKQVQAVTLQPTSGGWGISASHDPDDRPLRGTAAVHTLRAVMTAKNFAGGRPPEVESALALLDDVGDPHRFIVRLARASKNTGIRPLPPDVAIALEMALHEDVERSALDGELMALETEWAVAEEIARIADDMFVPDAVVSGLRTLRANAAVPPAPTQAFRGAP